MGCFPHDLYEKAVVFMKKNIGILFGGQSTEHEVSCMSAELVISSIDNQVYNIILIGITKEGKWLLVSSLEELKNGEWRKGTIQAILSPDASDKVLLILEEGRVEKRRLDVVFPVLHGMYGEDGTVQGILELAGIPYVGCGVLSSALSMDKLYTKKIMDSLGIRQTPYVAVMKNELNDMAEVKRKIEEVLTYPVFVKPSNAGSSCGVSKAASGEDLIKALAAAAEIDRKILVEEAVNGRELECAVLGGMDVRASGVGEILAAADFYDYDAKYNNAESKTVISPELPEGKEEEIRALAVKVFKALDGYGLARVDFFLTSDTQEVVFNEMNTLPGFTGISMYPMLWEEKGVSKACLVDKLIQSAYARR